MSRLLLGAACLVSAIAHAQAPPIPADPKTDLERGKQLASQVCAACHGPDGNSPLPVNPSIAAQHADYITRQLMNYKAGVRENPIMQAIAAGMTPDDMRAAAAYYSQQKARGQTARDAGLVKTGQAIWRGGNAPSGLPACSGCHSPTGAGIPSNYPRLAGQHAAYTYDQLKAFASGARGVDKLGKDVQGRIMHTIASKLTDAQMRALSEYAAGLRSATNGGVSP